MTRVRVIVGEPTKGLWPLAYANLADRSDYPPRPEPFGGSSPNGSSEAAWAEYTAREVARRDTAANYVSISDGVPFHVGNSIGGYVGYQREDRSGFSLRIYRLTGAQLAWSAEDLWSWVNNVGRWASQKEAPATAAVLRPGDEVLWAASSGSARAGLAHRYRKPRGPVEQALSQLKAGTRVWHKVPAIDQEVEDGGPSCHHQTGKGHGRWYFTDGQVSNLREAPVVRGHSNQYHNGCLGGYSRDRVTGGTYLIAWSKVQTMNGAWRHTLEGVWTTPSADLEEVARKLLTKQR